jgi:hypothetical protein
MLTAKDRTEAREDALYDHLYCEEEDRQRAEWEEEFGADDPRFPFKSSGVHVKVVRQMDSMRGKRFDD